MSSSSSPSQKCAVCSRSFTMLLWKHTCDACRKTVCDDCAPRNIDSVGSDGETKKLRVCQACGSNGRRLGGGSTAVNDTATSPEAPAQRGAEQTGGSADPNSEAERARRVAIIEARSKLQQSRGRPQGTGGSAAPRPAPGAAPVASPPPPPPPSAPASTPLAQSTAPAVTTPAAAAAAAATTSATNASSRPSNPALEAAMRRNQQQQARGGSAVAAQTANVSPEKVKLLREIDALLEKHREEPPFGLRASDETKLRGYLQYLKTRYKVSD